MLKWLVTKNPTDASDQIFTDDPFATLNGRGVINNDVIYSVSRDNPLYEDEDANRKIAAIINIDTNIPAGISKRQMIPSSPPESPTTDRESVKSSGYGSKEADSVSYQSDAQDDCIDQQLNEGEICFDEVQTGNSKPPVTVSQLCKSFENLEDKSKFMSPRIEILNKNPNYVESIEVKKDNSFNDNPIISCNETTDKNAEQNWPKVSHLAEALKRQTERISKRRAKESVDKKGGIGQNSKSQILRFNPLVSVVAQDRRYVTGISVSPNSKSSQGSKNNYLNKPKTVNNKTDAGSKPSYLSMSRTQTSKNSRDSKSTYLNMSEKGTNDVKQYQQSFDFKTNDSTIPSYFKTQGNTYVNEYPLLSLQPDSLVNEDTLNMMKYPNYQLKSRKNSSNSNSEENYSTADMPMFGKTIYSGFYSASQSESSNHSHYARSIASSTRSAGAKKKGAFLVKDLWEKSGLKTNGRKLMVDVNQLEHKSDKLPESPKSSLYNEENVYSVSNYIGSNPCYYKSNSSSRPNSRRFSNNSDENAYSTSNTDSSSNYERVIDYKDGIENSAFIDENGRPYRHNSKARPNFHNNLTNFQKKITDIMQSEPSHRKSWVDLDPVTDINLHIANNLSKENASKIKKNTSKTKHHPGKAVRDLGLSIERVHQPAMNSHYSRPWKGSMNIDIERSGNPTRTQDDRKYSFWNYNWKSSLKDASLSSFFSPHPNCGAIYERGSDVCHDFTLDAHKVHRLSNGRAKRETRRRCFVIILIFVALLCFLGSIIGISLYLTNGQRLFGAM